MEIRPRNVLDYRIKESNYMNKEAILKHTTSYEEELIEDLKDPEEAQAYLEAAFGAYEKDGDTGTLLLAMRDVAEAQGGDR